MFKDRIASKAIAVAVACAAIVVPSADGACEPTWSRIFGGGSGLTGSIRALAVFDDSSGGGPALYAGGATHFLAKWDGAAWSRVGSGLGAGSSPVRVSALTVFDDGLGGGPALYAGGYFTTADSAIVNHIAKWDGAAWAALGLGMNNEVNALTVFDDGSGGGPALYAGGVFTTAGGVPVNRVAKWNGAAWSAVGGGANGDVNALAVFDDGSGSGPALYAGGAFTAAGRVFADGIAKWDGAAWLPVGGGVSRPGFVRPAVAALTVFDDGGGPALYAGGWFTVAGGVTVNRIARWDGAAWSALGAGMDNSVLALTEFDDGSGGGPALYAGGAFTTASGLSAGGLAKWDGAAWSAVGSGVSAPVSALAVFDDGSTRGPALYAGGSFTAAGGVMADLIARWDGAAWSAIVGHGMSGAQWVAALAVFDDGLGRGPALYAGGHFAGAGGVTAPKLARWDGAAWSAVGGEMSGGGCCATFVLALAVFDDGSGGGPALYAAGNFTAIDGVTVNHIAKWDGAGWSALGGGMSGDTPWVNALAVFDDGAGPALYAGGYFTSAGGVTVNGIARWDGAAWSGLGSGMGGAFLSAPVISSLTVFDDGSGPALHAGGLFTTAGGVSASRIAKWNGAVWSSLGSGMSGRSEHHLTSVSALAVFDDGSGAGPALYAGGHFTTAGGVMVNHVARWDGAAWSALGSGMSGYEPSVGALTVFDDGSGPALYAGGDFGMAGEVRANNMAKWDGAWSALGGGETGVGGSDEPFVSALAVFDDGLGGPALYVGGDFTWAGGVTSNYIARWGCEAAPCYADCDGSGSLDFFDFLCFQNLFAAGDPQADCDQSGDLDVFDFLCFQNAFAAGCP